MIIYVVSAAAMIILRVLSCCVISVAVTFSYRIFLRGKSWKGYWIVKSVIRCYITVTGY
ncbi:hypothetical protein [Chitinophaga terrae (ex Kim and Jung 2007)]|uniref:hypothetical protein n=1 Tax=Chitinophaga terrae (ex Kim and Jung 2007) TaxID=408074 RepID=UPI001456A5EB|nr:hypothetical protein [Chitinophaga terrae (ex Kim and Jung 2007)]